MQTPEANLVIRPEKLGDTILATPVFRAFKSAYPLQPVHVLTDETSADLIRNDPHVDRIIAIRWQGRRRVDRAGWRDIHKALGGARYERAAILYYNCEMWNWVCALSGIRQVAQLGGTMSGLLLRHKSVLRRRAGNRHYSAHYMEVASQLGAKPDDGFPTLYLSVEEQRAGSERFPADKKRPLIVIHPFTATSPANLSLPTYRALGLSMANTLNSRTLVVGNAAEKKAWEPCGHPLLDSSLMGRLSVRELMVLLSRADLVVGGSSGVLHTAAALGRPVLGFYLEGHHLLWGPLGPRVRCLTVPENAFHRGSLRRNEAGGMDYFDLSHGISIEAVLAEARELTMA